MFSSNTTQVSSGGYQISRSLRFNSADSAYLNRTPASATNQKTWTWSGWVKRSALRANLSDPATLFNAGGNGFNARFSYANPDQLEFYNYSGAAFQLNLATTAVYRDVSAWYHIVFALDTTQATDTNRFKVYVNGTQVTAFSTATYPSQNSDMLVNGTTVHALGVLNGIGGYYSGYMTEVNFIDGQALTPSSFGETNAQTGVWQPKAYSGSYGTNGFYLNFSDNSNTTAATLGKDYSGNGNNWTPNNFSVTAGIGNDSLVDSPTSYGTTDTGVGGEIRGNYCTLNPLDNGGATVTNGNLDWDSASNQGTKASFYVSTGQYYWEITSTEANLIGEHGVAPASKSLTGGDAWPGSSTGGWGFSNNSGNKSFNGTQTNITSAGTNGDVMMYALNMDTGKIWFGRNGTWFGSGNPASGTNEAFSGLTGTLSPMTGVGGAAAGSVSYNFGQRPFAYTAPSGYKALCTQNLPTPTIGATSTTLATKFFNAVTWTGTGTSSARSITGVGFQPDFVWSKPRSTTYQHNLYDAVRGSAKRLISNSTDAEVTNATYGYLSSFDSDGFGTSAGSTNNENWNETSATYVAWNWKANGSGSTNTAGQITSTVSVNTTSGFSIVTFTTDGTTKTVGHGLGVKPSLIIVKVRSGVGSWITMTDIINGSMQYGALNSTAAFASIGYSAPTSTVFQYNDNNGNTQVAYCFASIDGYSKIGTYTGNGSTNGPFVFCGFKPAFLMIKRTDASSNAWMMYDGTRNTSNLTNKKLAANLSVEENNGADLGDDTYGIDFLSNGFKSVSQTGTNQNASGGTYIFMAFASAPFKYSLAR